VNTEQFKLPEPSGADLPIIDSWSKANPVAVPIDEILESGDAPPEVLEHLRECQAYMARWMSDEFARDRPITRDPSRPRIRLFDGPWIGDMGFRDTVPSVMEADVEDGDDLVRIVWPVWDTYEKAIAADDEEGCRRIAAAIYEYINCEKRMRRALVLTLQDVGQKFLEM
jgi:hypothetical protein